MESTIEHHEKMIENHDEDICNIRQDLVDIKTALGIKDLTNGQVREHQEQLAKAIEDEKLERKEHDKFLLDELKSIDTKIWFIVTGIILLGILDIVKSGVV